jgi:hypothetical protein
MEWNGNVEMLCFSWPSRKGHPADKSMRQAGSAATATSLPCMAGATGCALRQVNGDAAHGLYLAGWGPGVAALSTTAMI